MSLVRRTENWDIMREFDELSRRMQGLFGASPVSTRGGEGEGLVRADWAPSCNITESDKDYRIRAELPGVKKDDVRVSVEQGVMLIRGERREEKEDKNERYHRRELSYGHFERRFAMPADADENSIEAAFKDGMLEVRIAKDKSPTPKSKEIKVG